MDRNDYFEGAPTDVVEIRSPGDEAFEKLPFYAQLGVPEVWIIDRDSKVPVPAIYVLSGGQYSEKVWSHGGWLESPATEVKVRAEAGKLGIQLADDERTRETIPD
jgi:Uma2 family endonuclease